MRHRGRRATRLASAIAATTLTLSGVLIWGGPAEAVVYRPQVTLGFSGLHSPWGVAVDGAGDLYVSDRDNNTVVELTASGSQIQLPFSGLSSPEGVAVDSAGNVYVADTGNQRVVELSAGGSQIQLPFIGLNSPVGVAVDGPGDVYVADYINQRVVELTAGGSQLRLPFSTLVIPASVAVDGAGDVYVGDDGNNQVEELTAGGRRLQLTFSGLNGPEGLVVDAAGDVYVDDRANNRVVELTPDGSQVQLPFNGLFAPEGVTADIAGDVFVADFGNRRAVELPAAPPPGRLAVSPGSGPAGSVITVTSLTPCPVAATAVNIMLDTTSGAVVATVQAGLLDSSGDWAGELQVPGAPPGSYLVTAECRDGIDLQDYNLVPFTVAATPTTMTLSSPANPDVYGTAVRYVAQVIPSSGLAPSSGAVTFSDGASVLSAAPLESGRATFPGYVPAAGTHTISASFPGVEGFGPSSATFTEVITPAPTKLIAGAAHKLTGAFSATLQRSDTGAAVAGQTVTFSTKAPLSGRQDVVCSAISTASGVASCTGSIPALDRLLDVSFKATFPGSQNYSGSSAGGALGL